MKIGARVLVAEDEGLIAEELQDRLEQMGITVAAVVGSGEEAVRLAGEDGLDLVLMDIRLRGKIDGIDAAVQIQERFGVPVVFLTAHSDDATINRAKRTNPLGYLLKPFAARELQITIEMALHRHAAELRLKESEERYITTLTSIGDAVIATDPEGRITFMNPIAEALTGWQASDAYGARLEEVFKIVHDATRLPVANPLAIAMREGKITTLTGRTILITKTGEEVSIGDSAAPVRDARQHLSGGVLVFRDVTEQERATEALRKAEERFLQAQKMEAIGRLAGGVAHDINNLMTVVIGCGDMVLRQLDPDHSLTQMVQEMKDAGDRATAIVRQLLTFSRKQMFHPEVIQINAVVSHAEGLLRRVIGEDIELDFQLDPEVRTTRIDPVQMEQVILNLAINSRDAMPDGGRLTVQTCNVNLDQEYLEGTQEVLPGNYVMVSVADTGCGMDAETKQCLFEPFFTTKASGHGTGLGLATVYGIIKQSGGYIYVYSEPNLGTTFKIYLPEVIQEPASLPVHSGPAIVAGGHETILLVEDQDAVRKVTQQILQHYGYTVLVAADGEEALRLFEQEPGHIDLLLTDGIMPKVSGRMLAQRLSVARPAMKVIFMSGFTEDHILRQGIQASKVTFLQKPFAARVLAEKVREVLDRKD